MGEGQGRGGREQDGVGRRRRTHAYALLAVTVALLAFGPGHHDGPTQGEQPRPEPVAATVP